MSEQKINNATDITNRIIDDYYAWYGSRITVRGSVVATSTINTSLRQVKALFNWIRNYTNYSIQVIPADILEFKNRERHRKIIVYSEVRRVIEKCKNNQDAIIISVIFEAGLRIEEAVNMLISDLTGRKLTIIGKGDKERITFVQPETARRLRHFWQENDWQGGRAFRPLMHDRIGGYRGTDTLRLRIEREFYETLGIKMRPHDLRHAFALHLLENGCNLRTIQKLLGHAKIETTMQYLGITDKFIEKDYDAAFGDSVWG